MRLNNIYLTNYPIEYQKLYNYADKSGNNKNYSPQNTYTTWRFDEYGNIVYYTIDCETGEVISKEVYKNPVKGDLKFYS